MMAVFGILVGAALGTRYKVLCLLPTTLIGTAVLAALGHINEVPFSSTALSALAVGLQIGYPLGAIVLSQLPAALAGSANQSGRRRDQPASVS